MSLRVIPFLTCVYIYIYTRKVCTPLLASTSYFLSFFFLIEPHGILSPFSEMSTLLPPIKKPINATNEPPLPLLFRKAD